MTSNINLASKACPVVAECRDVSQGIANGDFINAGVNAGLLGLYSSQLGSAGSKALQNQASVGLKAMAAGGLSMKLDKANNATQLDGQNGSLSNE